VGQQTSAFKPDGWHGLALDKSTPEDAIHALGQPLSDTSDRLRIRIIDKWVIPKHKQKIFRVMTYKDQGEAKKAELAFLENKLVRIYIELEDKRFPAAELKETFGTDFVLLKRRIRSDSTPSMPDEQKKSTATESYPAAYCMISVTPQSLISAIAAMRGIKGTLSFAYGIKSKDPGSLYSLDMISRTLAKK
jgi:hypothetical protein